MVGGALWRIEYQADATRVDSVKIPLGFMLEADWDRQARWLGLAFRLQLTRPELDLVNLRTWAELERLEAFMNDLFNRAWDAPNGLGSLELAKDYPSYTAVRFVPEDLPITLGEYQPTFKLLYDAILEYRDKLQPVKTAEVVPLGERLARPFVVAPEAVELLNKAA